jgi:hypothetical protein
MQNAVKHFQNIPVISLVFSYTLSGKTTDQTNNTDGTASSLL